MNPPVAETPDATIARANSAFGLHLAPFFGIVGLLVLALGTLWTASHYSQGYSPISHFISELGWVKFSPEARVFNGSLILSSPLLFAVIYAFGRLINSWTSKAGILLVSEGTGAEPLPGKE